MATIYFNSSSNDQYDEHQFFSPSDPHHEPQFLSHNSHNCHLFFSPNNKESHPSQSEGDSFISSQGYDDHLVENHDHERSEDNGGLSLSLWKRETYDDHLSDEKQLKWVSSKMRVMLNMKNTVPTTLNTLRSTTTEFKQLEDHHDHKEPTSSSPMEETTFSNSINCTSSINNIPVRVCSDCNTTKTPLWRSGPQGPKSLCNACGIRQRKARKAMAMAAETSENVFIHKQTSPKATKILHKDYKRSNIGNVLKHKKKQFSKQRSNANPSRSSLSPTRKNRLEEFLVNLSQNLAFHRVFPQDEKEAAILLMAISCGYVHQ